MSGSHLGIESEPMLVYAGLAEHEGEELIEGDVLHHGRHDVTRLLRSESTSKFIKVKTKEKILCRKQSKEIYAS
jgi:hypothetical protein